MGIRAGSDCRDESGFGGKAQKSFENAPEDSQEFLKFFSFICMLSFDVYVKTLLIEKMIDGFATKRAEKERKKSKVQDKKEETDFAGRED